MVLNRHMGLPNLPGLSGGSHSKRSRRKAKSIYFLSKKIYHFVTRHTLSAVQMEMSCWDVCHTLCCSVVQDVCKRPFTTWPKDVHCRTAKADPSESSRAKKAAVAPGCQSHRQPKRPIFQGCSTQLLPFFNVHTSHSMICTILLGEGIIKKKIGLGKTPSPPTQPSPPHSLRTSVNLHKDKRPKSLVTLASKVPSWSIWSDWSPWSVRWPCQSDQSRKPDYFSHPSQSGHLTRTGSGKSVIMISVSKTFWLSVLVSFFHFPNNGRGMWRRNVQLNYATFLCEPAQTSTSRIKFSWFWMNS